MFLPTPASPDPTPEQVAQQAQDNLFNWAAGLIERGLHPRDVKQKLMERGADAETARRIVNELADYKPLSPRQLKELRETLKAAGQRNMAIGAVVCILGLVVTVATFAAASGPSGGPVVIAWGAVIFRGI